VHATVYGMVVSVATCIVSVMKWLHPIMEYGSTPYVGWHGKKVASPYNAYKIMRRLMSQLGSDYSHRLS